MNDIPPPFRKWDGPFLISIVAIALSSMFFIKNEPVKTSSFKQIVITDWKGEVRNYRLPVSQPTEVHISGPLGVSTITVSCKGARFSSSPCPNHICINHGMVQEAYDSAACIPNKIILTVELVDTLERKDDVNLSAQLKKDLILDGLTQ
jgi:hypothetical protein